MISTMMFTMILELNYNLTELKIEKLYTLKMRNCWNHQWSMRISEQKEK